MNKIEKLLIDDGIPAHLSGFSLLAMVIEKYNRQPLCGEEGLLGEIARDTGKSWTQVERAIRTAIDKSAKICPKYKIKTNKHYISTCQLILKGAKDEK